MARTTKRAKPKVPPVITKLLKTVNTLSVEEAVDELQLAWEEEPSLEKKRTLMKARIKLLEDAQKPKRGGKGGTSWLISKPVKVSAAAKKQADKSAAEEIVEAEDVTESRKKGGTGTVTALDLGNLGAMMGSDAGEDGGHGVDAAAAQDETGANGSKANDEATPDASAAGAGAGTDAASATAGAEGAIAMPPPEGDASGENAEAASAKAADANAEVTAETETAAAATTSAEPETPAYKEQQLDVPDYAKDELYQQIWKEMQQEGIDKLTKVRLSEDDFDTRLAQTRKDADWLGFGGTRMGDTEWANTANAIVFDCDSISTDWQLDQRLNTGITDLTALQGSDAPDLPEVDVPEGAEEAAATPTAEPDTAPEPQPEPDPEVQAEVQAEEPAAKSAEPALDPMANMDALFAELGDGEDSAEEAAPLEEALPDASEAQAAPTTEPESTPAPTPEPKPAPAPEPEPTPAPETQVTTEHTPQAEPTQPDHAEPVLGEDEPEEEIIIEYDPTPISCFSEDKRYMEIWEEMVVETLQDLGLAAKWQAEFDARLKRVDDSAARLLHAARQMEFDDWIHLLEDFNFDLPTLSDNAALTDALERIRADLQALRGDKPEVSLPAEDTYQPPKITANPQIVSAHKEDVPAQDPAADMRKPPKPNVTDTDESAQIRDDWESEDFWSWDDDGGDAATQASTPERTAESEANDEKPIESFDQDAGFRGVWQDMVQETLEGLRILRNGKGPVDERMNGAKAQTDRLLHAAEQMEYDQWVETLKSFVTKTRLIGDAMMLEQAIDSLLADLEMLHSGAAAVQDLLAQGVQQGSAQKPAQGGAQTAPHATSAVSHTKEEARAAAQSRSGKATLDDIYKFFPKPQ